MSKQRQHKYRHCMVGAVLWLLLVAPAAAGAARPTPPWDEPGYNRRLVCKADETVLDSFLVTVPWRAAAGPLSVVAYDRHRREVDAGIVFQNASEAAVLVRDSTPAARPRFRPGDSYVLYYGTRPAPDARSHLEPGEADRAADPAAAAPAAPLTDQTPVDPTPVVCTFVGVPGSAAPNAWERLLYMFGNGNPSSSRNNVYVSRLMPFDPKEAVTAGASGRRSTPRGNSIVRMQTWVLCPASGSYRFAVDAHSLAFLLVDGEPAAEAPFAGGAGTWHAGQPISLTAGPHRLDVFGFAKRRVAVSVAWQPPSSTPEAPFQAIPAAAYLAPTHLDGRVETVTRVLHPDFHSSIGRPYVFRDCPEMFVPVTLVNNSADWTGAAMTAMWRTADGARIGSGSRLTTCLTGGRLHPVTLEVRNALGFTAQCRKIVDCRLLVPRYYAVDADLVDLPAAGYPDDVLQPALRVNGDLPPGVTLQLDWQVCRRGGATESHSRPIQRLGNQAAIVELGRFITGDLATLTWQLRHASIALREDRVRFLTPPFADVPRSAIGTAVRDAAGNRLVLVPYRFAGQSGQAPLRQAQVFGSILVLDDMLTRREGRCGDRRTVFERTLEWIVDGPDHPTVTVIPLLADALPPDDHHTALSKFIRVPAHIATQGRADIVVLSLGLADIVSLRNPDIFERQAAALTDLVGARLGKPMVWVTPPPYHPDPAAIRPYAAAIQRIADARRIPVADLYSALLGMPNSPFEAAFELELTAEAETLAAQLVARAMLADRSQAKSRIRDLIRW